MRKLYISQSKGRYDKKIKVGAGTWDQIQARLSKFKVTDESYADYMSSNSLDQLAIKDVGWFVGGPFKPKKRRADFLQHRDLLTLDADFLDAFDEEELVACYDALGLEYVVHSSHKHSSDAPRLRIIFPLSRPVKPEEYEPLARKVASWFDMDLFDATGYQASRIMFWPSRSADGEEFHHHGEGEWLDPDAVLSEYDDWEDWGQWPVDCREEKLSRDPGQKAECPYSKPGIIGAFNRVYSVPHAIEEFELPYVPSGMGEDRYSYTQGESADGAIYYEDDGHLYSWHNTDPAKGNCNAWDLVRIHKFGELDTDTSLPIGKRESQAAMQAFAADLEEVHAELARGEFDDLGDQDIVLPDSGGETVKASELNFDNLREELKTLAQPDIGYKDAERFMTKLAASNLSMSQVDRLATMMIRVHEDPAPTKAAVMKDITLTRKSLAHSGDGDDASDIEIELLEAALEEHWNGGEYLRRFSKLFWTFEGGVWQPREDEWVRGKVQLTFSRLRTEKPKEVMAIVAALGETTTAAATGKLWPMFCAYVTSRTESRDPLRLMELDVPPVMNCLNCEVDFDSDTGKIKRHDHRPELFLTSQIPFELDAKADTHHWDDFCKVLFHDSLDPEEMQRHLEELCGYILQPWRGIATIVVMRGEPWAGKSTLGAVLNILMGRSVVNARMDRYTGDNDHADAGLLGKLLVLDEDFAFGALLPDGFVKKVSEAKRMMANPKGKDEFEFVCRAMPMIISNSWPSTRDHSGAIERRLLAWNLTTIPEEMRDDKKREALIRDGVPGALLAFTKGFARLYQRGGWDVPIECEESKTAWSRSADAVKLWLSDCVSEKRKGWMPRPGLYREFEMWFRQNMPARSSCPSRRDFHDRLCHELGEPVRRSDGFGWKGQIYKTPEFDDEDF